MASFHLSNCNQNLFQTRTDLKHNLPSLPSSTQFSFLPTLRRHSGAKFGDLRLKSLTLRRLQVVSQLDKSAEPLNSSNEPLLKIGIIGFGNFGQFIADGLLRQGHKVLATSRSDYSDYCQKHGIEFFGNVDGLCEAQPDVVLVCSSILSTETVLRGIPFDKLKPDTIFADVLSVKQFPRNLFLEVLPPGFGIVCTHPMFGPESGKNGWEDLAFVFDKVRITEKSVQEQKCDNFLSIFEQEGCRMVEMSCEEHDRHAAGSQFVTHTIGRILSHLDLESTPINTKGYETLLQLTKNTVSDSFDLYYGLFMYNVNATEQIENLDRAFETVKQKLFGRLHDILRKQIVERVPVQGAPQQARKPTSEAYFLPKTDDIKDLTSFAATLPQQDRNNEAISVPGEAGAGRR
ncbi:arogenate dehydrogenase 2, chloroplastic-like [Aristolochia californica]|uniref:arogenate dehydrogenase 2, chloroplastic-like n=1 Tax=Aristolochia californica TaxID=171875 RepID=UPI0035D7B748